MQVRLQKDGEPIHGRDATRSESARPGAARGSLSYLMPGTSEGNGGGEVVRKKRSGKFWSSSDKGRAERHPKGKTGMRMAL